MARSRWRVWWSKTHDSSLRRICSVHDLRFGANSHAILPTHVSLGQTSVPARALEGVEVIPSADHDPAGRDRLTATWVELAIRLGVLGLLLYLSFTLIRPFITIAIWSVALTVALYLVYDWMAERLGGRRRLAALLLTVLNLLIVIGPATWLTLGLIDSLRNLSDHLDPSALMLPPPPHAVKPGQSSAIRFISFGIWLRPISRPHWPKPLRC
jgi:hypothetical protein